MTTVKAYLVENGKFSKISFSEAARARRRKGANLWVDIEDPTKKELQALVKRFGFHHLAVEDAGNVRQRCKVEEYKDFIFIVLRLFPKGEYEATQLNFFLNGNLLVTTHFKCVEAVESVARELEQNHALLER
jgi:magnesium transporter